MSAERILITGATGFVGRHLVPYLRREGHALTLAVRNAGLCPSAWQEDQDIRIVETGDIETSSNINATLTEVTIVVHLAGLTRTAAARDEETRFINANVAATQKLVNAAVDHGIVAFIYLSSLFAVADGESATVLNDTTAGTPTSVYGRSKRMAENQISELSAKGIFYISLRLPLVVGPNAGGNWAALQKLAATGFPLPFGRIRNRRSIISVESTANIIAHLCSRRWPVSASGAYFLSDGVVSTADMVTELRRGMGLPARLISMPVAFLSATAGVLHQGRRIASLLGSCEVDDEGFRRTFKYQRSIDVREAIRQSVSTDLRHRLKAFGPKRSFDFLLAVLMLPIAVPVIFLCILAVKVTSAGPGIFRQTRIGAAEKPFICYKLRTMYSNTPNAPSHETPVSSVTAIGRWLRRLKLDELPQLWNVLRGDMSFVGPRPCLPSQKALILARRSRGLYTVLPGITGVSQVAGVDMSDPERLAAFDATYLKDMSLWKDMKLIVATAFGSGRGDRVC